MNLLALQRISEQFHCDPTPGFMTNTDGFILEANQAAADMFGADIPSLKNRKLCTFVADRKNSPERFNTLRQSMQVMDIAQMKNIVLRTQPDKGKKSILHTNITCEVVGRGGRIVLTRWRIERVIPAHDTYEATT